MLLVLRSVHPQAIKLLILDKKFIAIYRRIFLQEDLEGDATLPKEAQVFFQGYVYAELAEMYLLKEDFETSKKYAKLGLEKLSMLEWVVQSEPERISRLQELTDKN